MRSTTSLRHRTTVTSRMASRSADPSKASCTVLEVGTGRETGDVIDRANYASPSWLPDGRLLYSRLQKLASGAPVTDKYQNQRVYLHRLGSDPEQDVLVFGAGIAAGIDVRPVEFVVAGVAPGSDYVVAIAVNGTQREVRISTARVSSLDGAKTPWTSVADTPTR